MAKLKYRDVSGGEWKEINAVAIPGREPEWGDLTGDINAQEDLTNYVGTIAEQSASYRQEKLVSGENIKTINDETILGSGNIDILGDVAVQETEPDASKYKLWIDPTDTDIPEDEPRGGGDTLPVGTIINYDGTEIPSGYRQIGSTDYSTEEHWTGIHWVDNKKIYRKVILGTASSSSFNINLGLTNVDKYIDLNVKIIRSSNHTQSSNVDGFYNSSSDYFSYYLSTPANGNLTIRGGSSWPQLPYDYAVIVAYTKTTD